MIQLKRQIKKIYKEWANDNYIYQKDENNKYIPITYKCFIEESLSIANYLIKKGYKNKTILLLSENCIKLMECDLAISFYVGKSAIACREWTIDDLIEGINEIKADLIICSNKYLEKGKKMNIPCLSFDDIPFNFKKSFFDFEIKSYNKPAKIVFSSGTTGKSKGVLLSINNMFSGYKSMQRRMNVTHNDIAYLFLPLHHTYASLCHFMYSLILGHRIYLCSSINNIGKELLEVNPTVFCTVPLILNKLYENYKDRIDTAFGNRIKYIVCGGAPLDAKIRKVFKEKRLCLMQTYAMTETSSSFSLSYPYSEDYKSSGELYEDIDVRIDNPNKKGIGEIIVKGKNVCLGYINEALNKMAFDDNGFFHTGDLGYIKDNKIYINGRKKKMLLTSNGENIETEYIENKIKKLSNKINSVKVYTRNDKIVVNFYVNDNYNFDANKIIKMYNDNAPKYEKIAYFKVYLDSIDSRMK